VPRIGWLLLVITGLLAGYCIVGLKSWELSYRHWLYHALLLYNIHGVSSP